MSQYQMSADQASPHQPSHRQTSQHQMSQHQLDDPPLRETFRDYAKGLPWSMPVTQPTTAPTPPKRSSLRRYVSNSKNRDAKTRDEHHPTSRSSTGHSSFLKSKFSSKSPKNKRQLQAAPYNISSEPTTSDDTRTRSLRSAQAPGGVGTTTDSGVRFVPDRRADEPTVYNDSSLSPPSKRRYDLRNASSSDYTTARDAHSEQSPSDGRMARAITRKPVNERTPTRKPTNNNNVALPSTFSPVSPIEEHQSHTNMYKPSAGRSKYDSREGGDLIGNEVIHTTKHDIPTGSSYRDVAAYTQHSTAVYQQPRDNFNNSQGDVYGVPSYSAAHNSSPDFNAYQQNHDMTQSTTITTPSGYTTTTTTTPHTSRAAPEERSAVTNAMLGGGPRSRRMEATQYA